jgi:UDP-glucose 4-epimerase
VTGGLGFVGRTLCSTLADAGARVVVVDTCPRGAGINLDHGFTLHPIDIRDAAAMRHLVALEKPDTVFHLAARHFVPDCETNPAECLAVNVGGTQSLLSALSSSPTVERIVFASSGAVYKPSAAPHREDNEVLPVDIYGTSKALAERRLAQFSQANGVGVCVARLFNIYGPGETNPHLVPTVFQQASFGDVVHLGNLGTERDYVFLHDVVDALLRLGLVPIPRRVTTVNVGTGAGVTGDVMVQAIAGVLGRKLSVTTTTSRLRTTDRPRLVADAERARRLLGWSASTPLDVGLGQCAGRPLADASAWSRAGMREPGSASDQTARDDRST